MCGCATKHHMTPSVCSSTFILRRDDQAWRIVLYLNHQDMNKLLTALAPA